MSMSLTWSSSPSSPSNHSSLTTSSTSLLLHHDPIASSVAKRHHVITMTINDQYHEEYQPKVQADAHGQSAYYDMTQPAANHKRSCMSSMSSESPVGEATPPKYHIAYSRLLPNELIIEVLERVNVEDLYEVLSACRLFYQLTRYFLVSVLARAKMLGPALCSMARANTLPMLTQMLNNGAALAHANYSNNLPLRHACIHGNADAVALLLCAHTVDPSSDESFAIRCAASLGHEDIVSLLLSDGRCDPGSKRDIALIDSCRYGYANIVAMLVNDPRVNVNRDNGIAMRWAYSEKNESVMKVLWNSGRITVPFLPFRTRDIRTPMIVC